MPLSPFSLAKGLNSSRIAIVTEIIKEGADFIKQQNCLMLPLISFKDELKPFPVFPGCRSIDTSLML